MKQDISTLHDVKILVDTFYAKVQNDDLLKDIFNQVIQDNWPGHLEKMYRFWQTVLLKEHTYFGSPFPPHARLPVAAKHFQRWIGLFYETLDELFAGEKTDEAKWRSAKMAQMFEYKIEYYRDSPENQIL
jgi:hemoglobin